VPLPSSAVGASTRPHTQLVDRRWAQAYRAGLEAIGDAPSAPPSARAVNTAHPLFPVAVEWPVVVHANAELSGEHLTPDERRRGVHATHDLVIHRPVVGGEELTTIATVDAVQSRPPGAYQVLRLESTDRRGEPVATTRMGSLFLGVAVDGDDAGELVPRPAAGPTTGVRLATTPVAITPGAAHVYTETARIWNPIHTDAAVALAAGLPGPILHGTATLALAVNEVVQVVADGDDDPVRRVSARFGAMVRPGTSITIRVHHARTVDAGRVITFTVVNDEGELAVRDGVVVLAS
jgi:acyl dehydratase